MTEQPSPEYVVWRTAYWQFCDLIDVATIRAGHAKYTKNQQLKFWSDWMKYMKDYPEPKKFCIAQIQTLRGK